MKRPELTRALTPEDFQNTYFLKEELQAFAKSCGISAGGSKAELNERILQLLRGESVQNSRKERVRRNVREEPLSLDSIIEENIVCSQRHRSFFQSVIGKRFSFNVEFQDWLKAHAGLTYQVASGCMAYEFRSRKSIQGLLSAASLNIIRISVLFCG